VLAAGPLRGLVLAWLVFRPGRWQRVHYGHWRRGLAWAVPTASGLAVAECLLGQGRSLSSQLLREGNGAKDPVFQQQLKFLSFFFFPEMTCQNVIGGQKTRVFCHGLIEGALKRDTQVKRRSSIWRTMVGLRGNFFFLKKKNKKLMHHYLFEHFSFSKILPPPHLLSRAPPYSLSLPPPVESHPSATNKPNLRAPVTTPPNLRQPKIWFSPKNSSLYLHLPSLSLSSSSFSLMVI